MGEDAGVVGPTLEAVPVGLTDDDAAGRDGEPEAEPEPLPEGEADDRGADAEDGAAEDGDDGRAELDGALEVAGAWNWLAGRVAVSPGAGRMRK